jgi:hypothetical protein
MSRLATSLLLIISAGILCSGSGWAGSEQPGWSAGSVAGSDRPTWQARVNAAGMSLDDATALAQSRFPGRVVKAETQSSGGRRIHVVRIINDKGRVRTFRIDAQSGEFL